MSELKQASLALSFCSVLYRTDLWDEKRLIQLIGDLGVRNDFFFTHDHKSMNEYYNKEMQGELGRFFVVDSRPCARELLIEYKLGADRLEKEYSQEKGRGFNFDPGIITMEHLLLATGKPYSHRPYLGDGVYGELTYHWEGASWKDFPWTYPDYRDEKARSAFELVRTMLKEQLST